jgi:2-amino-4-hydroxy-6-hydroxymethyldihydropteridine diphosphokinase
MSRVFLGVGTNLGNRLQNIKNAFEHLKKEPGLKLLKISSIYETEPVGVLEQPLFLNTACEIATDLKPHHLLKCLLLIETALGRIRDVPQGPREIDLDILFYDDLIVSDDRLVIPHPLIAERAFVLVPLNEIAPDFFHPVFKLTVSQMLSAVKGTEKVRRFGEEAPVIQ